MYIFHRHSFLLCPINIFPLRFIVKRWLSLFPRPWGVLTSQLKANWEKGSQEVKLTQLSATRRLVPTDRNLSAHKRDDMKTMHIK